MDLLLPPWIPVASIDWRLVDLSGISDSSFNAAVRTFARGQRIACSVNFQNLTGADRHALMAWAAQLRGKANRAWIYDPSNWQRGSFPGGEKFTNNTFADGTTGWSLSGTGTLTAAQRVARITTTGTAELDMTQVVSGLTQFRAHAIRSMILDGVGSEGAVIGPAITDGAIQNQNYTASRGLITATLTASVGSAATNFPAVWISSNVAVPGAYFMLPYTSLQQCGLVDGGPNAMLYSDTLTNAVWTKGLATASTGDTAPDGSATACRLTETAASGLHYAVQTQTRASGIVDVCGYGCFKRAVGTRDVRLWATNVAGTDSATCTFDLGAGTAGPVGLSGSATAGRAFIVPMGNNWYFCAVVARMPSSTSIACEFDLVSGGSVSYLGTTGAISTWRVGAAVTSNPTRGSTTTSTAATGAGSAGVGYVYLTGLPPSTNGLALAGDRVEINGEMKIATSDLNTDAAGRGRLQFEPVFRTAPPDGAAVIFGQPMCRMLLMENAAWQTRPGRVSDFSLSFLEASV